MLFALTTFWCLFLLHSVCCSHGLAPHPSSSLRASFQPDIAPSHAIASALHPERGSKIPLKPYDDKGRSVWQEMLRAGGWMVQSGKIVRVFEPRNQAGEESVLRDDWFLLEPTITFQATDDLPMFVDHDHVEDLPCADDLLWIAKPAGLLTLPGKTEPDSLSTRVNWFLQGGSSLPAAAIKHRSKRSKKTKWVPRPCHRLDQDTSGIVVMAKTKHAYTALSKQFEKRWVRKQYVALVDGIVESEQGTIDAAIGKVWDDSRQCQVWSTKDLQLIDSSRARTAVTDYFVSRRYPPVASASGPNDSDPSYTRIILQPKTGRGHQLRLHMADVLGRPILGDTLHGSSATRKQKQKQKENQNETESTTTPNRNLGTSRLCLHAEYLEVWVRTTTNNDDGGASKDQIALAKCWWLPPF